MRCGDFKESYIKDEEIFQSIFVKFWLALFFLFLLGPVCKLLRALWRHGFRGGLLLRIVVIARMQV